MMTNQLQKTTNLDPDKIYSVMFCSGESAQLTPKQTIERCAAEELDARIFEKYWIRIGTIYPDGTYKDFGEFTPEEVEEIIKLQDCIWNWKGDKTAAEVEAANARFQEKYSVFRL